jgi:hypothetical protein
MNIGKYKIHLTLTIVKNEVNEREIIRTVEKVVSKKALGMTNHILRIKEIRNHPEFWLNLKSGENVSLFDAKNFADNHWKH